jgi:muconolactone delta-isomerase
MGLLWRSQQRHREATSQKRQQEHAAAVHAAVAATNLAEAHQRQRIQAVQARKHEHMMALQQDLEAAEANRQRAREADKAAGLQAERERQQVGRILSWRQKPCPAIHTLAVYGSLMQPLSKLPMICEPNMPCGRQPQTNGWPRRHGVMPGLNWDQNAKLSGKWISRCGRVS